MPHANGNEAGTPNVLAGSMSTMCQQSGATGLQAMHQSSGSRCKTFLTLLLCHCFFSCFSSNCSNLGSVNYVSLSVECGTKIIAKIVVKSSRSEKC